jgi:hypothetical protein
MIRVYIAGPISIGDLRRNIDQAERAFAALQQAGIAPFLPHLSAFYAMDWIGRCREACNLPSTGNLGRPSPLSHEQWLAIDFAWLAASHAVLRLPGESVGADAEVAEARRLMIPVFFNIKALIRRITNQRQAPGMDSLPDDRVRDRIWGCELEAKLAEGKRGCE